MYNIQSDNIYVSFNSIFQHFNISLNFLGNERYNSSNKEKSNFILYEKQISFEENFEYKIDVNISNEYFEFLEKNIDDPNKTELNSEK